VLPARERKLLKTVYRPSDDYEIGIAGQAFQTLWASAGLQDFVVGRSYSGAKTALAVARTCRANLQACPNPGQPFLDELTTLSEAEQELEREETLGIWTRPVRSRRYRERTEYYQRATDGQETDEPDWELYEILAQDDWGILPPTPFSDVSPSDSLYEWYAAHPEGCSCPMCDD